MTARNDSWIAQETRLAADTTRNHAIQLLVKSCLDWIAAGLLILLLSPLLLAVSVLIVFESGFPIIYRRRVVGTKGEFEAFKFRSMRQNADAILAANPTLKADFEQNFKLKNDPRLTRIGGFLRTTSLDELPQVFNVLRGQMSLVGPRMKTPVEVEKYASYKELLLTVKPGITGYWQVNGRQNIPYDERIKMDLYYIQNWSLAMDLKILFKTPLKVLVKEGAY